MYNFTEEDLKKIYNVWAVNGEFGPRAAYRWWHKVEPSSPILTTDVEDFAIAFMTQYNKLFPRTF